MVTNARQWKTRNKDGTELELPSGNTILARPIRPEAFIDGGIIPDPLMSIIQESIREKRGLPPDIIDDMATNSAQLGAALEMFDRVWVYCLVEPVSVMPPVCMECGRRFTDAVHLDNKIDDHHQYSEPDRNPDVLYADIIDLEDKQFLFQWSVGGVADVSRFREELQQDVDAVQPGQGILLQAQ